MCSLVCILQPDDELDVADVDALLTKVIDSTTGVVYLGSDSIGDVIVVSDLPRLACF